MSLYLSTRRDADTASVSSAASVNRPGPVGTRRSSVGNRSSNHNGGDSGGASGSASPRLDAGGPPSTSSYRVFVRIRPFLPNEMDPTDHSYPLPPVELRGTKECLFIDQGTGIPRDVFHFDGCFCSISQKQWERMSDLIALPKESLPKFPPCASQDDVFDAVGRPMVDAVMEGFNASILAYGQTSSGKTFTMMGSSSNEGLIPRIARAIMEEADRRTIPHGGAAGMSSAVAGGGADPLQASVNSASDGGPTTLARSSTSIPSAAAAAVSVGGDGILSRDFFIELSFFEIYNEAVLDLLHAGASQQHRRRKVRVHPVMGVYVEGLTYEKVSSWGQCFRHLQRGLQFRHTAATKMNEVSSRSHAIFQLRLVQNDMTDIGPVQHRSNVYLADLAGSERIKLSAVEGERLKESAQINLSLTTLRRVIDALIQQSPTMGGAAGGTSGAAGASSSSSGSRMVPYRESMLTWVLSESLGGNAKACMVATLCPHPTYVEETYQTLQYAHRAKSIVNSVVKNEDQMAKVLRQLQDALAHAAIGKNAPMGGGPGGAGGADAAVVVKLEERVKQQDALIRNLREEQMLMLTKYADLKDVYDSLKDDYAREVDQHDFAQRNVKGLMVQCDELHRQVARLREQLSSLESQEASAQMALSEKSTECDRLSHHKSQADLIVKRLQYDLDQASEEAARQRAENDSLGNKLERLQGKFHADIQQLKQQHEWDLTACFHIQHWYHNALQSMWDVCASSRRVFLQSQVMHVACDWAKTCGEQSLALVKRVKTLEKRLQDLEYVNGAQDKSLSQVAALYVSVREFIHCVEQRQNVNKTAASSSSGSSKVAMPSTASLAALEANWTVAGMLKALHSFCDAASRSATVAVRAEMMLPPTTSHSSPQASKHHPGSERMSLANHRGGPAGSAARVGSASPRANQRLHAHHDVASSPPFRMPSSSR